MLMLIGLAVAALHPAAPGLRAEDRDAIVKSVKYQLKDPDSAKFKFPEPIGSKIYCGWVNSRNSYGGLTGFEVFEVPIFEFQGRLVPGGASFDVDYGPNQHQVEKECRAAGYIEPVE